MNQSSESSFLSQKSGKSSFTVYNDAVVCVPTSTSEPNLERIMDTYGSSLLRLCYMYLKDMHLAEDAVQDTFVKVYRNYDKFDGGTGERAWVSRIAINVCKDMLRSAWHKRVNVVDEMPEIPVDEKGYNDSDSALLNAVMALKPKYREAILMFYYLDMKISDIATTLGTPESTVSVRLKRARDILKKQLGGWHYAE